MHRRTFIRVLGGSFLILGGGLAWWAGTRFPAKATVPWRRAGAADFADPRLQILSYAILAPNPHNRQPWLFELLGDNVIVAYNDPDRMLPSTDPQNRQITIGHGCMLELLSIAARELGFTPTVELFPEGTSEVNLDGRPVARVLLSKANGVARDPLFGSILNRRSNKEAYDIKRPVEATAVRAVLDAVRPGTPTGSMTAPDRVSELRDLTIRAIRVEWGTYRCNKETVDLLRIGKGEIEANPDGIDLDGVFIEALRATGGLERKDMLDTTSSTFKQALAAYEVPFTTSMGFVWLVSPDNTRASQIEAGRSWVRMNLAATSIGLGVQPASQALQEYQEMAEIYKEAHALLAVREPQRLQMLARIGYGPAVPQSPRWPLESKMRS